MKINDISSILFGRYINNKNKVKPAESTVRKTDAVNFSDNAKVFADAVNKVKNAEPFSIEKVNSLKAKIESGTYNVKKEDVAEKIIEGLFLDKKI